MKKIIAILLTLSLLLLSGCFAAPEPPTAAPTEPPYLTDVNGQLVPAFHDVALSELDPTLFSADERGRMRYLDETVTTYTGVDISVFQGDVDFAAVKADGIDFVILRAGYRGYGDAGILGEDDNFRKNCAAANAAGLKVGAYFFSQAVSAEEAVEEARFLCSILEGCTLTYPVAYDWESIDYDTARTDDLPAETVSACAEAFCTEMEAAGYRTLVYINCEHGYFRYSLPSIQDRRFWLAEYSALPSFVYRYEMWQYSRTGAVAGIEGDVDLNISVTDLSV